MYRLSATIKKTIMRNIPENNLAYPVLIKTNSGSSGSGFMLNTGNKNFLITAKHVLINNGNINGTKAEIICQTCELDDDSVERLSINFSKVKVLVHDTADVAAIEIAELEEDTSDGSWNVTYVEGIVQLEKGLSHTVSVMAKASTKKLQDVLISNNVFLYGYATSLSLNNSPQFDYNKPLLRKGIISNKNKSNGTIILDCPVYPGNSGGPVIEVEQDGLNFHHKVIGVVSEFVPFVQKWVNQSNGLINTEFYNSGYSVAVSMDSVFEIIGFDPSK